MRVRDHLALSTAGAAALRPWIGRGVIGLWAGSVLIDADHYLWFAARRRRLSPLAAIRFFNAANPPQHSATRTLHSQLVLLALAGVAASRRQLRPVIVGMGLHVALDMHHETRMDAARARVLERDAFSCRACGAHGGEIDTHLWRQPWLLPSYQTENLVALCGPCHETAHRHRKGAVTWS